MTASQLSCSTTETRIGRTGGPTAEIYTQIVTCVIVTIRGQPAIQVEGLKRIGVVRNNADLVCQAISALYQRAVDERLKIMRLKTLEKTEEDEL